MLRHTTRLAFKTNRRQGLSLQSANLLDDHRECLETCTHKPVLNDPSPSNNQRKKLDSCDAPLSNFVPVKWDKKHRVNLLIHT